MQLFKNTNEVKRDGFLEAETNATLFRHTDLEDTADLNAGDTLSINVTQASTGAIALHNDILWNVISISKIS